MKLTTIVGLLMICVLFQNCTVYEKIPVSIDDVASNEKDHTLVDINGMRWDFKDIQSIDGKYYVIIKNDTTPIIPILLKPVNKGKVKMVNPSGMTWKFDQIVSNDGKYYGIKNLKDTTRISGQTDAMKFYRRDVRQSRETSTLALIGSLSIGVPILIILFVTQTELGGWLYSLTGN